MEKTEIDMLKKYMTKDNAMATVVYRVNFGVTPPPEYDWVSKDITQGVKGIINENKKLKDKFDELANYLEEILNMLDDDFDIDLYVDKTIKAKQILKIREK